MTKDTTLPEVGTAAADKPGEHRAPEHGAKRPLHTRMLAKESWAGYVFLTPWLVGFLILILGPLLASLYLSFTDYRLLSTASWIGVDNYVEMFTNDPRYLDSLSVTFRYVFISVPMKLVIALIIAMALRQGLRALGLYRAVFYVPSLLGTSVGIAILWRQVFGEDGIVNDVIGFAGVELNSWITDPDLALWTLIILAVWQFGAPMVIFIAGLNNIPRDYYDAASVDGAGWLHKQRHVTLPLLTPIIFFNLVFEIINTFQMFSAAYIISGGRGGPLNQTLFYTLYLYQQGFVNFEMGYASAMAWVLLLIIAAFTSLLFKTAKSWVFYSDK